MRNIMKKLRNPVPAAKLLRHTLLSAKCKQIRQFLSDLEIEDIESNMLNSRENRRVDSLDKKFSSLDSVTLAQ